MSSDTGIGTLFLFALLLLCIGITINLPDYLVQYQYLFAAICLAVGLSGMYTMLE